jgi:glutaredoxin
MTVEFLWFNGCPNHEEARRLLADVMSRLGIAAPVIDIDATSQEVATATKFPGSPTIRINGEDIEPGFVDPGDYTPRCRLYLTASGLRGLPDPQWIEDALVRASAHQ